VSIIWSLLVVAVVSYLQSILFTWQSRARNQNDVDFFVKANICANIAWYINQVTVISTIFHALTTGSLWQVVLTGVVYIVSTSHSATVTMKYLIKHGR
jgi:hypothetical protein